MWTKRYLAIAIVAALLCGCSGGGHTTKANPNLEVRGRIQTAQPLQAVVTVQFYGSNGGMEAYTSAQPPDGSFHIPGPPNGPGVPPGEYKIVVVDPDLKAGIPETWQDPARSPLKVIVNAETAQKLVIGQ